MHLNDMQIHELALVSAKSRLKESILASEDTYHDRLKKKEWVPDLYALAKNYLEAVEMLRDHFGK